jgi:hypothetical protein
VQEDYTAADLSVDVPFTTPNTTLTFGGSHLTAGASCSLGSDKQTFTANVDGLYVVYLELVVAQSHDADGEWSMGFPNTDISTGMFNFLACTNVLTLRPTATSTPGNTLTPWTFGPTFIEAGQTFQVTFQQAVLAAGSATLKSGGGNTACYFGRVS